MQDNHVRAGRGKGAKREEKFMNRQAVLFVLGKDRPGIVDDVSTFLFERGANIEDSRMATLAGSFSIMILFSCTEEALHTIGGKIDELGKLEFKVSLHETEISDDDKFTPSLPLKLEVTAMDNAGIVQKIVRILRRNNVNIRALNTEVTKAPLSGAPLFGLNLEAAVPAATSVAAVKGELNGLAAEMNLDLIFKR